MDRRTRLSVMLHVHCLSFVLFLWSTTSIYNFFRYSVGQALFHNSKEHLLFESCLSVCLSVCPSVYTYQRDSNRISVKFVMCVEKVQFCFKSDKNIRDFTLFRGMFCRQCCYQFVTKEFLVQHFIYFIVDSDKQLNNTQKALRFLCIATVVKQQRQNVALHVRWVSC